jgi:hypothetical protein
MSDLYDHPKAAPEPGLNLDCVVALPAEITLQVGSFNGKRWFAMNQAGQSIAVDYEELGELISGLSDVWAANEPDPVPEQLRLFDPDNPPEAPSEHRMDPAH